MRPNDESPERRTFFEGLASRVAAAISSLPGARRAWIFGSFARGEETDESDVDVFFTFDGDDESPSSLIDHAVDARKALYRRLTGQFDREFDVACCSEETFEAGGRPGVYSGVLPAIVKSEGVLVYA